MLLKTQYLGYLYVINTIKQKSCTLCGFNVRMFVSWLLGKVSTYVRLDILFRQMTKYVHFTKIYQLKGLAPKNKGHTNFDEHSDLTKKYI